MTFRVDVMQQNHFGLHIWRNDGDMPEQHNPGLSGGEGRPRNNFKAEEEAASLYHGVAP